MMDKEAKAVQEFAKAGGSAIEAAREAGGFIAKFVAGPLEQGMGIVEDHLRYMRWERQERLMVRAEEFLKLTGQDGPTRRVPLNLAIPLIQGASLEEDDDLQDRWAALLVHAATATFPGEIRRAYASILEQLTPLDARVLDAVYSVPFEECQHDGVVTWELPNAVRAAAPNEQEFANPSEAVTISLSNLTRLGCVRALMTWGGGEHFGRVNPTFAGKAFVEACRVPSG